MDTCTRSTLIARSTRSLSGVLIASILGLSAIPRSAFASEPVESPTPNTINSAITIDPITQSTAEEGVSADSLLANIPNNSAVEDTPESEQGIQDVEISPNTDEGESVTPQISQQPYLTPFVEQPETQLNYEDAYVLGPQDQIRIDIFNVPEFSGPDGEHTILVDGTSNFPWIGSISLQGLTLTQASDRLEQAYAPYINDPLITVSLIRPRAIRISVVGEVNRPGSYTLDPIERVVERVNNVDAAEGNNQWTSLIQAIQTAGGITQTADVREIQIQRPSRPEGEQTIVVSLWDLLQNGDLNQDISLRDGDTVYVPRATTFNSDEYLEVAEANFAPDFINTYVVGEVKTPGELELRPNTTLNQAILAAGGFENNRAGRVELIRLNPDGTMEKRDIDLDLASDIDEENNPVLRDRDIILVGRSSGARIVDFLDTIFSPVADVIDLFGVFDLLDISD